MPKSSSTAGRRHRPSQLEFLEARDLLAVAAELLPGEMVANSAESVLVGDLNGDRVVDNFDISAFELALANPHAYLSRFPSLGDFRLRGDASRDGALDSQDIQPFEKLVSGSIEAATTSGIWISADEISRLPKSGVPWITLLSAANRSTGTPNISDQNEDADVRTLAKALVGVRLKSEAYLSVVRSNVMAAIGTESDGQTLALGRNLASYVIAADLAQLSPSDDATFRTWLRSTLTEKLSGGTLRSTHEERPNNWGTMAGASRAAVAVYLGDSVELARVAQVFKGWLGDRSSYAGFKFGDPAWQADPSAPVGINPAGATKDGHSIDGALPEEMRRGGPFVWPPTKTDYAWGALQGAVVQAEILYRAGYDAWQWSDRAILRAVKFLYSLGWKPTGDDQWIMSIVNARYDTSYSTNKSAPPGKIMGWTAWTHPRVTAPLSASSALALEVAAASPGVSSQASVAAQPQPKSSNQAWPRERGNAPAATQLAVENLPADTTRTATARRFVRPESSAVESAAVQDLVLAELDCALALERPPERYALAGRR